MSQDGVVVLCHDAVLKRLYGVEGTVTSLPWEGGLDQLRTIREPHSPMMTFHQLCHKLASSSTSNGSATSISANALPTKWSDTWILIDIKVDAIWSHKRTNWYISTLSEWRWNHGVQLILSRSIIRWKFLFLYEKIWNLSILICPSGLEGWCLYVPLKRGLMIGYLSYRFPSSVCNSHPRASTRCTVLHLKQC